MRYLTTAVVCLFSIFSFSQVPQAIKYQGVIRANNGDLLGDSTFQVKLAVREASLIGTVLYEETHNVITNSFGSFALNIGQGAPLSGSFSEINWGIGEKFLEQSVDFGNGFLPTGGMQFLSVPYALHAANGLPAGGQVGQVLSVDGNGNFIWLDPSQIGQNTGGSNAATLTFTSDGF